MSELDDKLKETLERLRGTFELTRSDGMSFEFTSTAISQEKAIQQIKQAFTEAGWVQTLKLNDRTVVANGKDPLGYAVYYPDEVLTGQEWYDRFDKEFIPKDTDCAEFYVDGNDQCDPIEHARRDGRFFVAMEARDAAKRASGITEKTE